MNINEAQIRKELNLILYDDFYPIPSNFPSLTDIDQDIYKTLITKGEYKIKSKVDKRVLESFIDNWVNGAIPQFTTYNIFQFERLSSEFDRMQNMIQIYKNNVPVSKNNVLFTKINNLKLYLQQKSNILKSNAIQYNQIITILLNSKDSKSNSEFYLQQENLNSFCQERKINLISNLVKQKISENGLVFVLNEEDKTASLLHNNCVNDEVIIPYSVKHNSQEYIVTSILKNSFLNDEKVLKITFSENSKVNKIENFAFNLSVLTKITTPPCVTRILKGTFSDCPLLECIEFSKDSKLEIIEAEAFTYAPIRSIVLPSSFSGIDEKWCHQLKYLTSIKIVKSDVENIKYFDDKFIVGKSDPKSDIFDVLLLARRDVKDVVIPAFIKRISAYAFQFCEDVKKVIFQEKSELKSIGFSAFSQTNIESIQIPDHVTDISSFAFHFCEQLKTFSCSEKSELKFIGDLAFAYSSIQSLTIPSSVQFDDKCFYKTNELTQIKIIQNGIENIKYIDDKFIVGKNNPKSDIFDVLLFVRHDVEEVTVPSQIRRIASFAFGDCFNLKNVDFLNDSQLKLIENDAFYDCNVKSLTIPATVAELREGWCFGLNNLTEVKIMQNDPNFKIIHDKIIVGKTNSKSDVFDVILFALKDIRNAFVPSYITRIASHAFQNCKFLKSVEFENDSNLDSFGLCSFCETSIESIKIPKNVTRIEQEAFSSCRKLTNVEFDDQSELRFIEYCAFSSTKIQSIVIPPKLIAIQKYAFLYSDVEMIEMPAKSQLNSYKINVFGNSLSIIMTPSNSFKYW